MLARISRLATYRPSAVLLVALLAAGGGLAALPVLPLETLPSPTHVAIRVQAYYPGATPQELNDRVAVLLETAINRIDGVKSLTSECGDDGIYHLLVDFNDVAEVAVARALVQGEVASLMTRLPAAVRQHGITVEPHVRGPELIVTLSTQSSSPRARQAAQQASEQLQGLLERAPGVGKVQIVGAHPDRLQVTFDPAQLAARRITTPELIAALDGANSTHQSGTAGELATQLRMLEVRSDQAKSSVLLTDVAEIEARMGSDMPAPMLDRQPVICLMIYSAPGANGAKMSRAVQRELDAFRTTLPRTLTCTIALDRATFTNWSLYRFAASLLLAIFLATLCHFLLTANLRATVALATALGVMVLGFSGVVYWAGIGCSLGTVFALILALCLVLMDSVALFHDLSRASAHSAGLPRNALSRALKGSAVPSTILKVVILSALMPLVWLGSCFPAAVNQFVAATAIGLGCALVTTNFVLPAFLALMLRRHGFQSMRFVRVLAKATDMTAWIYARIAQGLIWQPVFTVLLVVCLWAWAASEWQAVPGGMLPTEGQGYLLIDAQFPTQPRSADVESLVNGCQRTLNNILSIDRVLTLPGYSAAEDRFKSNALSLVVVLKADSGIGSTLLEERKWIETALSRLENQNMVVLAPSLAPDQSSDNTLCVRFLSNDAALLKGLSKRTREAVAATPSIASARIDSGELITCQVVNVDPAAADRLDVRPSEVVDIYRTFSQEALLTRDNGVGPAINVKSKPVGNSPQLGLNYVLVRTGDGRLVPLRHLASVTEQNRPQSLARHNLTPATTVTAFVSSGAANSTAAAAIGQTLRGLPLGSYTTQWIAGEGNSNGREYASWQVLLACCTVGIIALLFCYLLWQPDAWVVSIPIVLLAMAPLALLGAAAELRANGLENHLFAKAAMLTVLAVCVGHTLTVINAARARRAAGDSISEAAAVAIQSSCRPILSAGLVLMAFCPPLIFAQGAGAVSQHAIGVTLLGGIFSSMVLVPLLAPSLYVVTQWGAERLSGQSGVEDVWRFGQSRDLFYNLTEFLTGLLHRRQASKDSVAGAIAIVTVTGRIKPIKMGTTLAQERLFTATTRDQLLSSTKESGRIFTTIFDHVTNVRIYGGHTIVDGVTAFEGRNPRLLEGVSRATGIHILTNTGYTAIEDGHYLPQYFLQESSEQLAERWLTEYRNGIDNTGISPGFIKIGCDASTVPAIMEKLCAVAALTHLESGMAIASDVPDAVTAHRQLDILAEHGVSASAWVWLHAQREADYRQVVAVGKRGAWIEIDDFSTTTMPQRMQLIRALHAEGLVGRILVSQHSPGFVMGLSNHGARIQRLDRVFKLLIPELFRDDFLLSQIKQMTVTNPSRAYMTCVRRLTNVGEAALLPADKPLLQ